MSDRRLEMITLYGVIIKRFFLRQTQGDSCDAIFC
jgi:hypothetical protein